MNDLICRLHMPSTTFFSFFPRQSWMPSGLKDCSVDATLTRPGMIFNLDLGTKPRFKHTFDFYPRELIGTFFFFFFFSCPPVTIWDMELPFLRNADVNIKRNELSLPTLIKEYLLFNLEKDLSLGLLDLPSFSLAFKLIYF